MQDKYRELNNYNFANDILKDQRGKRLSCLIFGNFGAYNLGDDSILLGQLEELSKIKNLSVHVVTRYPRILKESNFTSVQLFNIFKLLKIINKSNFVIFGGGGLFAKNSSSLRGILFQLYFLNLFLLYPLMARKDIYVLGIGFYKNMNEILARLSILFLKHAKKVTVRDFHSYDFLKKRGVKVKIFKDNSYLMELYNSKRFIRDHNFIANIKRKTFNVGLSLKKPNNSEETSVLIREITKFIKSTYTDTTFWFYSLDNHPSYFSDKDFAMIIIKQIKKELGDNFVCYSIPETWNASKVFSSFKFMSFFIAMRFHSMLFSHRNKISFIGLNYDLKCSSFIDSVGGIGLRIKNVSSHVIEEEFRRSTSSKKSYYA